MNERDMAALNESSSGTPLVAFVDVGEDEPQVRTYIVGAPEGHFVSYRPLDFVMNAKTTKKDLKEVELD